MIRPPKKVESQIGREGNPYDSGFRSNALVETKRGRRTGHRALDGSREEVIQQSIRTYYLQPTRPSVSQLVRDIQTDCAVAGLKPPHRRTIEKRIDDVDLRKRAHRRGEQKIKKATMAVHPDKCSR